MKGIIKYLKKVRTVSFGKVKDNCVWKKCWKEFSDIQLEQLNDMEIQLAIDYLVSNINYLERYKMFGCEDLNVDIRVGDVCYIDFGCAYIQEIGYQHFGLILSIYKNKAFVVPMSSNQTEYEKAYDDKDNPNGSKHLMRFEKLKGMNKNSVLFINDAKWINTARIIDVKSHLKVDSKKFSDIMKRVKDII